MYLCARINEDHFIMHIRRLIAILIVSALTMLFCVPVKAHEVVKYLDVDSIGDVWIFAIDKTASMLTEHDRAWHTTSVSPSHVCNSVMSRLGRKGGILDCIDYENDMAFFYETGYGEDPSESTGTGFRNAAPLEYSFIHEVIEPIDLWSSNIDIEDILYGFFNCDRRDYKYRESFVSQIRVLTLHRAILWLQENEISDLFNRIHIIIITDDAEQNDQWRTDYYNIMHRSKEKIRQLNALHEKYIYSTFTQRGGGLLEENEKYSDISDPRHIYRYDYTTLQQRPEKVNLQGQLLEIAPMDGEEIGLRLTSKVFRGDTVIFAYIDSICVNGEVIQVARYTSDTLQVVGPYHNRFNRNDVSVYGKIQVEYEDSIYGMHMRKIDFEMHDSVITVQMASRRYWAIIIAIVIVLLVLLFVLVLLPNRYVFTLYTSDGEKVRVRRGYKWQWDEGINPLLHSSVDPKSRMVHTVTAKHACFSKSVCPNATGESIPWVILSRRPLAHSAQMEMMDTSMNIGRYIQRHDDCPAVLKQLYEAWGIKQVDKLADHRWKWVRSVGRSLQRLYHCVCPHYAYWMVNANMGDSLIVTSSLLPASPFLLEVLMEHHTTANDRILNSYYRNPSTPKAEVLIATTVTDEEMTWNVYHLSANLRLGHGIGDVKHMAHYTHPIVSNAERDLFAQRLRKAIQREMKISSIYVYHMPQEELVESRVVFQVEENSCLYYLYLVDDTEKRKAQMIYSPFSDNMNANMPRKMVLIKQNRYDKELYSSLLPFESAKNMPGHGACMRESAVKFPAGGSLQGELSIEKKAIKFLNVTINTH